MASCRGAGLQLCKLGAGMMTLNPHNVIACGSALRLGTDHMSSFRHHAAVKTPEKPWSCLHSCFRP